ncbi:MAG: TIGR00282 family metallophosphoesterase [Candidatus Muiribacteriota bacterium]
MNNFKIMMIGDVIGRTGRKTVNRELLGLRAKYNIDIIIANGENSAGGLGINQKTYSELLNSGVDIVTLGNHLWDKKEIFEIIEEKKLVRPLNYTCEKIEGRGVGIFEENGVKFAVISLLGRVFMPRVACPFRVIEEEIKKLEQAGIKIIIIDFHAEATSEKQAMGFFVDGKVSVIAGTHTHVQTNDERILQGGTGYITDLGMTGDKDSVIGVDKNIIISRFLDQMPKRFEVSSNTPMINGIVAEIDIETGKCKSIIKINY